MALGVTVSKLSAYFHNTAALIKFAKRLPVIIKGLQITWCVLSCEMTIGCERSIECLKEHQRGGFREEFTIGQKERDTTEK